MVYSLVRYCLTIVRLSYGHNMMVRHSSHWRSPRERFAMRYSKGHKQETRQRIVEAAGRRFKQDGIDGAGIATVMSDAGLTNGAFYAHFASKGISSRTCSPTSSAPNARASTPSLRTRRDSKPSSAPTY